MKTNWLKTLSVGVLLVAGSVGCGPPDEDETFLPEDGDESLNVPVNLEGDTEIGSAEGELSAAASNFCGKGNLHWATHPHMYTDNGRVRLAMCFNPKTKRIWAKMKSSHSGSFWRYFAITQFQGNRQKDQKARNISSDGVWTTGTFPPGYRYNACWWSSHAPPLNFKHFEFGACTPSFTPAP